MRFKYLAILLFIINQVVFSLNINDQVVLKHISIEQRLPGASLQYIIQDSKGLMWFCIESVGLCKYDGQNYTVYNNILNDSNSLSNNFPTCIVEDKNGFLWVGTDNGLNKFNRKTEKFTRFYDTSNNSISNNLIKYLFTDKNNYLWIGTAHSVSIYNLEKGEFFNLLEPNKELNSKCEISSIYKDKKENIWIGTFKKGLFLFSAETLSNFYQEWDKKSALHIENLPSYSKNWVHNEKDIKSIRSTNVRSIEYATDNKLWIGTKIGLDLYDIKNDVFTHWRFEGKNLDGVNDNNFAALKQDKDSILWIGLNNSGVVILDWKNNKTKHLNADNIQYNGLKSNIIRDIFIDASGMIWIASKSQGINIYDKKQDEFFHITEKRDFQDGLNSKNILSVYEDKDGMIWISTGEKGLNKYNPQTGKFTSYFNNPSIIHKLKRNEIEIIKEDSDGKLWLGSSKGLIQFNKQNEFILYNHFNINNLLIEKDIIWISTHYNGVFIFNKKTKTFSRYQSKHTNLFSNQKLGIKKILKDKNNYLWFASIENGLYKYNIKNDELKHYTKNKSNSNSISSNMIRSVFQDSDGTIWIGTKSQGLNAYNPHNETFNRVLSTQTIYSILEDDHKNLWLGTHEGIIKYNINDKKFIRFNKLYGLQGDVFMVNAFCKDKNGYMYFGGANGLNVFHPDRPQKKEYIAPLIISSFKVFDKQIDNDINEYKEYKLKYNYNYISFEFSLLDYSDPINNKYAYKLENFDKDWVYCGNRNYASYTSLPPGEYIFNVKGENVDGDWNNQGIKIKFTIPLPYWRTWWFIIIIVLIVLTLIGIIYYLRISRVRRNEKNLLKIVKQKTHDVTSANDILEQQKKEIQEHNKELIAQRNHISIQNKELENHRTKLEKLVFERTKDLEQAKIKAENSDKLKSAFLANMSHEIRTPLNAIVGFADLIANEEQDIDDIKEINKIIKVNSDTLLQFINDIIDISKIESNLLEIQENIFNLNEVITNLFKSYNEQLSVFKLEKTEEIKFSLTLDESNDKLKIISDEFRIKQIFNTLFSNAIKFTKAGYIKMGYRIPDNKKTILFFMEDSGIGIANENLENIFDRFRKIEESRTEIHRGTGLGLTISSNLSVLIGGKMWVESKLGKGACFFFELPLKISEKENTIKNINSLKQEIFPDWSDYTLLLVENEKSNYKIINAILRKTKIKLLWAKDGGIAVDLFKKEEEKISIILMDINLPNMNGIEATKIIKERNKFVPIIAQSEYTKNTSERAILDEGFDGCLSKPIIFNDLIMKLSDFL